VKRANAFYCFQHFLLCPLIFNKLGHLLSLSRESQTFQTDPFCYGSATAEAQLMNLAQIIDALPLQVYLRRGELVIQFSTPVDLISRLTETAAALSDLERQLDGGRQDGRAERTGRRGPGPRSLSPAAQARLEPLDPEDSPQTPA
jgi:hypothetical protein